MIIDKEQVISQIKDDDFINNLFEKYKDYRQREGLIRICVDIFIKMLDVIEANEEYKEIELDKLRNEVVE